MQAAHGRASKRAASRSPPDTTRTTHLTGRQPSTGEDLSLPPELITACDKALTSYQQQLSRAEKAAIAVHKLQQYAKEGSTPNSVRVRAPHYVSHDEQLAAQVNEQFARAASELNKRYTAILLEAKQAEHNAALRNIEPDDAAQSIIESVFDREYRAALPPTVAGSSIIESQREHLLERIRKQCYATYGAFRMRQRARAVKAEARQRIDMATDAAAAEMPLKDLVQTLVDQAVQRATRVQASRKNEATRGASRAMPPTLTSAPSTAAAAAAALAAPRPARGRSRSRRPTPSRTRNSRTPTPMSPSSRPARRAFTSRGETHPRAQPPKKTVSWRGRSRGKGKAGPTSTTSEH
jgi:hypothetical protein